MVAIICDVFSLGLQLGSWKLLREKVHDVMEHVRNTVLNDARIDILAPKPIRGLIKLALRGDRRVIFFMFYQNCVTYQALLVLIYMYT